jgi:hypothetical protein
MQRGTWASGQRIQSRRNRPRPAGLVAPHVLFVGERGGRRKGRVKGGIECETVCSGAVSCVLRCQAQAAPEPGGAGGLAGHIEPQRLQHATLYS